MQLSNPLSLGIALALGFAAGAATVARPTLAQETATDAGISVQDASMDDMMAAWIASNAPGEHHALLEPMVGEFDCAATYHMGGQAIESRGHAVNTSLFEGRFLQQDFTGEVAGNAFTGRSVWGYSNADETYKSTWIDSMSTELSFAAGWVSEDGKTFTMIGTDRDPMGGGEYKFENVFTVVDENEHSFDRYETHGEERALSMRIVYSRRQ